MPAIYKAIFANAIAHNVEQIRFFCWLAKGNAGTVRDAQLRRARLHAQEIRETRKAMLN